MLGNVGQFFQLILCGYLPSFIQKLVSFTPDSYSFLYDWKQESFLYDLCRKTLSIAWSSRNFRQFIKLSHFLQVFASVHYKINFKKIGSVDVLGVKEFYIKNMEIWNWKLKFCNSVSKVWTIVPIFHYLLEFSPICSYNNGRSLIFISW